jgi:hypothetical protein
MTVNHWIRVVLRFLRGLGLIVLSSVTATYLISCLTGLTSAEQLDKGLNIAVILVWLIGGYIYIGEISTTKGRPGLTGISDQYVFTSYGQDTLEKMRDNL